MQGSKAGEMIVLMEKGGRETKSEEEECEDCEAKAWCTLNTDAMRTRELQDGSSACSWYSWFSCFRDARA